MSAMQPLVAELDEAFLSSPESRDAQRSQQKKREVTLPSFVFWLSRAVVIFFFLFSLMHAGRVVLENAVHPKILLSRWGVIDQGDTDWRLPTLGEFEANLSERLKDGKAQLAAAAKLRYQEHSATASIAGQRVLEELAKCLSNGQSSNIEGLSIRLRGVTPLGFGTQVGGEDPGIRTFTIRKYLGSGADTLVLEVVDEFQQFHALRFSHILQEEGTRDADREWARRVGSRKMTHERRRMIEACGGTDPKDAATDRGLALISSVGTIEAMPLPLRGPFSYILPEVHLMERFQSDLSSIFTSENRMPVAAKEYAATRLVLEVLHLQRAGFSHNDIKLGNLLVREDGSFLLGDFGSGTTIGEHVGNIETISYYYAEPELGLATFRRSAFAFVDAKSDMWSLGMNLYRIFMDGEWPYHTSYLGVYTLDAMLRSEPSSSTLKGPMEAAGVPERWQSLIMSLLEVKRRNRIDAQGVLAEYADLLK